jgi:hypothetical protein
VVGGRESRPEDIPHYRWVGKRALDLATNVRIGKRLIDAQSGFRAYSRKAITTLVPTEFGMGADSQLLMQAQQAGLCIDTPVSHKYQGLDRSTHHPVKHWLDVFFSVVKFVSIRHPMLFYGGFAAASLIVSLLFGLMAVDYYRRFGYVVTNFALISIAAGIIGLLALFTAIILFTLLAVVHEPKST